MWPVIEEHGRRGAAGLQGAEVRAVPGGRRAVRAWRSAAAARSCCIAPPSQAHAETYMGLVEVGVGVDPRLGRLQGDAGAHGRPTRSAPAGRCRRSRQAFETIRTAQGRSSAAEAKEARFLRGTDGITMNRDRLLADAKARRLALAETYQPPEPVEYQPAGPERRVSRSRWRSRASAPAGKATPHDRGRRFEKLARC